MWPRGCGSREGGSTKIQNFKKSKIQKIKTSKNRHNGKKHKFPPKKPSKFSKNRHNGKKNDIFPSKSNVAEGFGSRDGEGGHSEPPGEGVLTHLPLIVHQYASILSQTAGIWLELGTVEYNWVH